MGCYDLYDETLPCQWIDSKFHFCRVIGVWTIIGNNNYPFFFPSVTDLYLTPGYTPETEYTLAVHMNPDGYFPEVTTENNQGTASVVIANIPPYDGPSLADVVAPDGPGTAGGRNGPTGAHPSRAGTAGTTPA